MFSIWSLELALRQRKPLIRGADFLADFGQSGGIVAVRERAVDPGGDLGHFSLFHAASGDGGGADADAAAEGDLFGVEGNAVFVHGDGGFVEGLAGDFAIEAFRIKGQTLYFHDCTLLRIVS